MPDFDLKALHAPFPRSAVSWRAQNMKKDGTAALALAYIDARDVMNRLDEVMGPENWSDSYEVHQNVTICSLALRLEGGWVTKADGAGDTDVEAEKGRISDAFKRSAVRWGIGRYLYSIDSPWVPCESYEANGKFHWRRWKADPWSMVKDALVADKGVDSIERLSAYRAKTMLNSEAMIKEIREANTLKVLDNLDELYRDTVSPWFPGGWAERLLELINERRHEMETEPKGTPPGGIDPNESLDRQFRDTVG